jgi:2-hydroxy-6-oxonona-2,4-dienedioate hydrolase
MLSGGGALAQAPNGEINGLHASFIDVDGVRTRYYDYGQGEPIVLVHGGFISGSSTANNWSRNIPELAEHYRVIAVDRLAQGMTGNPKDGMDFTNEAVTQHLYGFVRALNLDRIHLVGHSSGGGIAFYLAVEHPELVKTLTVLSSGPEMPPAGEGPTKFAAILATCPPDPTSYAHLKCRLLALAHSEDTFPPEYGAAEDYMGNLPKSVEGRKMLEAMNAAHPGVLEQRDDAYLKQAWDKARNGALQMPIMILTGMQDTLSWDADDEYSMHRREIGFFDIVARKNTKVKLVIMNDAGHFPYREHPKEFDAELMGFVQFWDQHPNLK